MLRPALIALLLTAPLIASAQSAPTANASTPAADIALPQWQHTSINDFAAVLSAEDTQALDQALIALYDQTGVEGTVVTLTDRASYGGTDGLERFATRLFNHWGIGDATRNDDFMVLYLQNDREARIELGRGYPRSADLRAEDVMWRIMVPAFKAGNNSAGLRDGTLAVIDQIARPHAAGQVIKAPKNNHDVIAGGVFGLALAGMGALIWRDRRRRNTCPECGHRGLETVPPQELREDRPEGGWLTQSQSRTRRCPACGWQDTALIPLPSITYYDRDGRRERADSNPLLPNIWPVIGWFRRRIIRRRWSIRAMVKSA